MIYYGTRYGATKETSEELAKVLREENFDVKVVNAQEEKVKGNMDRLLLAVRIEQIKKAAIGEIIITEELREQIIEKFFEERPYLQSRNQRDIGRLLYLIKANALLNFHNRNWRTDTKTLTNKISVIYEDLIIGFKYYSIVSRANELGISPEVLEIYEIIETNKTDYPIGFTRKDFEKLYYHKVHKFLGRDKATRYLEQLQISGLITEGDPDPQDKRITRYVCIRGGVKSDSKNIEDLQAKINKLVKIWSTNLKITECHIKFNVKPQTTQPTPPHTRTYIKISARVADQPFSICHKCEETKILAFDAVIAENNDPVMLCEDCVKELNQ